MRDITTKKEALETLITLPNRQKQRRANIFQKKKVFQVKVLTPLTAFSGPGTSEAAKNDPEVLSNVGIDSQYLFKGRIIDDKMAHVSYLEDPCDSSIFSSTQATAYISMHTNFILSKTNGLPSIGVGDIVFVELEPGQNNALYDLQFARIKSVKKIMATNQSVSDSIENCKALSEAFGEVRDFVGSVASPEPIQIGASDGLNGEITTPTSVALVYWYSGMTWGGKHFVVPTIESLGIGQNIAVVVGESTDNYAGMESDAETFFQANGWSWPPSEIRIGGWSLGGKGLARHLAAKGVDSFSQIEISDPNPTELVNLSFNRNTNMLYRPDNWPGLGFEDLFRRLGLLVINGGGGANIIEDPTSEGGNSHVKILQESLKLIIN